MEMISEIISTLLTEKKYNFEMIESSIYNFYANEPEFAKSFKKFFGSDKAANNLEEQMSILSELVIKQNSLILRELQELKELMRGSNIKIGKRSENEKIEASKLALKQPPPPPKKSPQPVKKIDRNEVMSELRKVFKLRNLTS